IDICRLASMPVKGATRQTDRDCLVCGETTRIAHLGIDLCRACAVFYRRARGGNDFVCRSITGQCASGKSLNCKRCRYDQIVTLLERSGSLHKIRDLDGDSPIEDPLTSPVRSARSLLDRVKTYYNTMSLHRLTSELNARREPPHPLEISLEKGPFFSADFAAITSSVRILMTAALEFGNNTFPEFAALADSEKWELAMNFFYRFRMFESFYRTTKTFANDPNKLFVSYATYFTIPFDENFFETAPKGADIPGVLAYMRRGDQEQKMKETRDLFARLNMADEEFLSVAVLMFWSTSGLSVSDQITMHGERYREEILKELHAFYREEMRIDDYAIRLGELMMMMEVFERTKEIKEHFEMLRLYNIMTDDNFIYRLQKDLTIK
ncbi:hypothetical protein PENTCL1PPCAC_14201, partial [Pristionchus entomophagus]